MWELVEKSKVLVPSNPLDETIKSHIGKIKSFFRNAEGTSTFKVIDDLTTFSKSRQMRLIPNPDWHQAILTLDEMLLSKLKSNDKIKSIDVIVYQPCSSSTDILRRWMNKNKIEAIYPPTIDEIVATGENWINSLKLESDTLNIFNGLENYFLAHHLGLDLVRQLFDIITSSASSFLLTINSWAWNYLNNLGIVPLLDISSIRYVKPNTGDELQHWITELTRYYKKRQLIFRKTNNGNYLLPPINAQGNDKITIDAKFFNSMAAYCLGNPMIALEYWRMGLRVTPDEEILKDLDDDTSVDEGNTVLWILPWEKIPKAILDKKLQTETEQLLWYIILHQPINRKGLKLLMRNYTGDISDNIAELIKKELIIENDLNIEINPISYPAIAKYLLSEGYLSDQIVR